MGLAASTQAVLSPASGTLGALCHSAHETGTPAMRIFAYLGVTAEGEPQGSSQVPNWISYTWERSFYRKPSLRSGTDLLQQERTPDILSRSRWLLQLVSGEKEKSLNLYQAPPENRRRQWHPTPVLLPGKSHGWRGRLQSMGSLRVGHDWATSLSLFTFMHWRRKWHPTPVFLPGKSQGRGSLVAAVYGVTQSRTWLKWLSIASREY